jgi:hypothetical protein
VTDHPESPEAPDEPHAGDVPAALEPDAPTVAQPVIEPASGPAPAVPLVPAAPEPPPAVAVESRADGPSVPKPLPAWTPPNSPAETPAPATETAAMFSDRPEIAVGAAFAGGFVLALILKRLGH